MCKIIKGMHTLLYICLIVAICCLSCTCTGGINYAEGPSKDRRGQNIDMLRFAYDIAIITEAEQDMMDIIS